MNPVKNFSVLFKISLIIAIVSVPVVILSVLFFDFKTDAVEFAEKEITGVEYIRPVQDVLKHVAAHQSMAAAAQQNSSIASKLAAKQGEVDVAIRAVSQVDTQSSIPLGVSSEWSNIESQWLNLRNGVSRMSAQKSIAEHERLVGNILAFIESVGDASNLILDPVLDSYYLMDSIVIKLPAVQSEIESLRSILAFKERGVALTNDQLLEIKVYLKQIEKGLAASRRSLEVAFDNNASLKGSLETSLNRFINESKGYASFVASLNKDSSDSEYLQAFNSADSVISSWDQLSDAVAAELIKVLENRVSSSKSELYIDMALVLVCIFIALACGIWVIRSITKPMARVIEIFHKIEEGDLSSKIEVKTTEETGKMLQALSNMQTSLGIFDDVTKMLSAMAAGDMSSRLDGHCQGKFKELQQYTNELAEKFGEIVGTIQESAHTVKTTADEIAEGNNNLSTRTESQAASLEQTAASMEQVTGTIVQNTENAREANQLASDASETAKLGGEVVDTAIAAMDGINESSQKIADIISVIDEIAFQTNLLALNASVEAARAGEQGRGFAVVAGEVRNLAGRSATSAKEIKELIEDSVSKVEEGSRLVNQSGENLAEIVASVKKVSDIVAEITAASEEQAIGIEEINRSITKIDEVTQQNTALVEEVAAASETMGSEAADLEAQMRFFTIDGTTGGARSAAKPQPKQAERRQPDRAWSESSSPAAAKAEPPVLKAVGGDDDFWEEF